MNHRIIPSNLARLYQEAAKAYGDMPAFAIREGALNWKPVTYSALYAQGLALATGLIELGVKARDHVGLFGDNRYEWILSDCAVQLCGAADVPRGRDITDSELAYIIYHAGISVALIETEELQGRLLKLKPGLPILQHIILLDPKGRPANGVVALNEVIRSGQVLRDNGDKRVEERMEGIKPSDLFTLIYTSGTTGQPKGVMLTHANMVSQIRTLPGHYNCNDRILSVLPVWHIFERVIEMYTLSFGGCTFYSGIHTLADDLRNVEPTFMASAPRLWEKLNERILKAIKASHPVRQVLFHIAYYLSKQYKNSVCFLTNKNLKMTPEPLLRRILLLPFHAIRFSLVLPWYGFFNAAVLERIRQSAGGSIRATISGGGALPADIDRFFNYVGIPVLEGYGMTETSPVIAVRSSLNLIVGTVGPPIPETEVRIVNPETEEVLYPNSAKPHNGLLQKGEIWVKGPQVMKGYYQDEELTRKTVVDGWMRTGDLGTITFNNCLKILGRCKATIVLRSGENVEPEPIEMRLQQSRFIEQCMVTGQDKKFLGALIVPDLSEFRLHGFGEATIEELAQNPKADDLLRQEIRKMISGYNGFKRYEQVNQIRMVPEGFRVGYELTNLFKIKRHIVSKKYEKLIEELHSN